MATTAPPKPNRETWLEWLPPGQPEPEEVLSRDELLARLRSWRVDATERDLQFWEYEGVLPRSIRRSHRGVVRAVYPSWYAYLVREVRRLQRHGFPLEEIRRRAWPFARYALELGNDPSDPIDQEIRAHANVPVIAGPEDLRPPEALVQGAEQLARWHERFTDMPTDHVDVWVVDVQGNQTCYTLPIADPVRFLPESAPRQAPAAELADEDW